MSEDDLPAEKGKRGAKPFGKPTLKTIAQMTGFAVTTISRPLNNAPELSQDIRDRVQKVAAEAGYLPDRAALRLKTGRTNVIALALEPDEQIYSFGISIVGGFSEALPGHSPLSGHNAIIPQCDAYQTHQAYRTQSDGRWGDLFQIRGL
ncbi:MAG: LacI family DNA-binding transcriptional regulator [Candidatus Devosia symbiotica]|nr:LacI family DNA-binding transcriptional regulator [Candidatus Devosia symbiotica]